jgi:hypothetical protein
MTLDLPPKFVPNIAQPLSSIKQTMKTKKIQRKFLSEFALNLYTSRWLLIPSSQVTSGGKMSSEDEEISRKCHVYLICERPSVTFDDSDFSYVNGQVSGNLIHKIGGLVHRTPFCRPFPLLDGAVALRLSEYPYREIVTFDAEGKVLRHLPASMLSIAHQPRDLHHTFRQLKVLYVGQAFGGGNRNAVDRLRSHSTLQKILAEASYNSPDVEIMVLTVEYEPYRVVVSMDGRAKEAISDKRDDKRFFDIKQNPLKLGQQISLAEAALIRYFQPHYNKIYKKKFPSRELKVLAQCYDYDFSALMVEINTDEMHFSLFSEVVDSKMHHLVNIDLVSHEQRASFFHIVNDDGEHIKVAEAIGSDQKPEN